MVLVQKNLSYSPQTLYIGRSFGSFHVASCPHTCTQTTWKLICATWKLCKFKEIVCFLVLVQKNLSYSPQTLYIGRSFGSFHVASCPHTCTQTTWKLICATWKLCKLKEIVCSLVLVQKNLSYSPQTFYIGRSFGSFHVASCPHACTHLTWKLKRGYMEAI